MAGSAHLLAHLAFPAIVGTALLHVPLLVLALYTPAVSDSYLSMLAVGGLGFASFATAVWSAQRVLGDSRWGTARTLPLFLVGSMSLAVNNTRAVYAALTRVSMPFHRTPKGGAPSHSSGRAWAGELLLGLYSAAGLGVMVHQQIWSGVPFQSALALSFLLIAGTDWWERVRAPEEVARPDALCKEAANPTQPL
jgi:hypothetical protein